VLKAIFEGFVRLSFFHSPGDNSPCTPERKHSQLLISINRIRLRLCP
jgi:hypothetical protein